LACNGVPQELEKTEQGILNSPIGGLDNFHFFETIYFARMLRNSPVISLLNLVLCFPLPILLVLLLDELRQTIDKRVIHTVSYLPHFVSQVVWDFLPTSRL
jgi:putative aldouronate transport system permease protein